MSQESAAVKLHRRGPAVWMVVCRPHKANSYTAAMLNALDRALVELEHDADVRVLVITGAGSRAFCAGADREEMAGSDFRRALDLKSHEVFARLASCSKVTLAAINGAAVGGGLELALACDLRVAVEDAVFAMPEPSLGIIPAAGGVRWLPRLVGMGGAKALILGGATWSAQEAHRYGLIHSVVPRERLCEEVGAWVERIAERDPLALRLAKEVLNAAGTWPREAEKIIQALLYQLKWERSRETDGCTS